MGKGSGGGTNTVTQTSSPPPQFLAAYQNAVNQAQNVASTSYQPYPGPTVAPLSGGQQYDITTGAFTPGINWQAYANNAQNYYNQATTPFYDTVSQYESPYTQDVVNTTERQFNNQNAIQNAGVVGNAVAQGAWGGDRSAVAQGIVAGQQQTNEAPVIAGLYNQGYQTALNANEAQNWLASNAASGMGNLATGALGAGETTFNNVAQTGNLQQQQEQAQLNVPYYQYLAGQAYPFQTTGWLANIAEGLGSGAGGQSSTTSPGASPISQALGLGIGGAGLIGATGGFGSSGWLTGAGGLLDGLGGGADLGLGTAIDATGVSSAAEVAAGLPLLFKRGGEVRRADGGDVPFEIGPLPYQRIPSSGNVPNVGISIVPQLPQMRGGIGPPRPPAASPSSVNLSPQGIFGMLQASGGFGQNGWLSQVAPSTDAYDVGASPINSVTGSRRGGAVPHYQDGGDLVSGLTPPDQPTFLGIAPDMRSSPDPSIATPTAAPSIDPASRAGIVQFWIGQGANPKAAQGIADRVAAESGFNPGASGDLGTSHGLYQEHDTRAEGLRDFADSAGASPNDPSIQNAFAASEVHGGDPIATKHWQEIANAPDEATGARLWDQYFERSAGSRRASNQTATLGIMPPGSPQPPLEAQMSSDGSWDVPATPAPSAGIAGQPAGMYSPGVNPWLALAAAGFATAAGRSPQALQNLGAGALAGVQTLESERAAIPEQQLRLAQGQMANLQVQNAEAMRAYFSGQHSDPAPVADQIDNNIKATQGAVAKSGETSAISTPSGAVAPLPGQTPPLSADEQAISQQVQGQIGYIDRVIAQQSDLARFVTTPEQMSAMQATLARLAIERSELLKQDPAYIRSASQAGAEGKVGPAIQQAAGEAAAKLPYTITTSRPGSTVLQGGRPIYTTPIQRNEVDPTTGAEYPRFVTPPLPGQAAPAAPSGAATSQQSPAGIAPGTLPVKLGPGQETALKERAEAEQKDRQETIEGGEAAQTQQAILSRLKDDAPQFTQGPFAQHAQTVNSYLRAIFGTQAPQVASYEDFIKNAGSLTRAAVRETSSRAAVQEFKLIDATLPSPEMSPQGLQQVINEYQGLNDFKLAKVQAQQQWEQQHGGIGNVQGFESDWQAKVSPYAFVFNRMDPAEQAGLVSRLRGTPDGRVELQHLAQQLQYAKSAGLEPYIQ